MCNLKQLAKKNTPNTPPHIQQNHLLNAYSDALKARQHTKSSISQHGLRALLHFTYYLITMRMSRYQYVCAQLPLCHSQCVGITPRHDLVSMYQAYAELPYLDHLRLRKCRRLFEVTSHDVHIRRQSSHTRNAKGRRGGRAQYGFTPR